MTFQSTRKRLACDRSLSQPMVNQRTHQRMDSQALVLSPRQSGLRPIGERVRWRIQSSLCA